MYIFCEAPKCDGFCMTCSYFDLEVNGMWMLYWYVLVWGQQSIRWKFCYVCMIKNNQSSYLIQVWMERLPICTMHNWVYLAYCYSYTEACRNGGDLIHVPGWNILLTPPKFHYISWFLVNSLYNYIRTYLHSLLHVCNDCKLEWLQTFERRKNIIFTDMLDCKTLWHWL